MFSFVLSSLAVAGAAALEEEDALSLVQLASAKRHSVCPEVPTPCPDEGKVKTNECPKGCKFIEDCDVCKKAAAFWKLKYNEKPWPAGPRPTGCFRNRKWQIKCNKKLSGPFRGKWPVCQMDCDDARWAGTEDQKACRPMCTTTTTSTTTTTTEDPCPGGYCSAFSCPKGYGLKKDADTICGTGRATCCQKKGICEGQPVGGVCGLGDLKSSLIPNPSFEEHTGCPTSISQLNFAKSWHQATAATSDYWIGPPSCSKPRGTEQFPQANDGDAVVGAIRVNGASYVEYVGSCLQSPIVKGNNYTFNFAIAATRLTGYGTFGGNSNGHSDLLCIPACGQFPIGGHDYKGDNYPILAKASPGGGLVEGGGWKALTFTFTASNDCPAIMFGPSQDASDSTTNAGTYLIFDALNLQPGEPGVCDADGNCVPNSSR